jgi:hypothetical protein
MGLREEGASGRWPPGRAHVIIGRQEDYEMRKLSGALAVAVLTLLALSTEVQGTSCTKPIHCPEIYDCSVTGCVNGTCEYFCW